VYDVLPMITTVPTGNRAVAEALSFATPMMLS
jgi:hypothetical protein